MIPRLEDPMKEQSHARLPAMAGGSPAFPEGLPLARPSIGDPDGVAAHIRDILESGTLTNGRTVRRFEEASAEYLGVRHTVAVGTCTTGLMLLIRAADLSGDVIIPSFTFAATAHAVAWNGLRPVFADVDPVTLTLDPTSVARTVGIHTSAILATHVYGNPCDVDGLGEVAERSGLHLFFDAAHAFGSRRRGRMVGGFGDGEVFSLSPTKVIVAGEGGLIATDDELLAERCRMGRDYGHPGDYDCRFVGLNGRMSELHAAVALASLEGLGERIEQRNRLVLVLREALRLAPGISFPRVQEGDRSTFKDLTLLIDADAFGMSADALASALAAEGVETKRYYSPPVHRMVAYRREGAAAAALPATERASEQALTLPLWHGMTDEHMFALAEAIQLVGRFGRGEDAYAG
jgi:dTDP-4-amino-4,6-dideoxygalactose transaminase